ncbi:MAG: hypothetical protein AAGD25_32475 [Cyanobacteria bacterium P01_F01_bin.150]
MSYRQFTTIEAVQESFGVRITSAASLFADIPPIPISSRLQDLLQEQTSLALNINTEKARSELIIAPVLVELRRLLNHRISLFSGIDFTVDSSKGLTGFCDYILSNSSDQIFLQAPVACLVEAKNENIRAGYGQCVAEMIAAHIFNERAGQPVPYILGIITTGSNWKFLRYQNQTVAIDFEEYLISQIDKILGILVQMMRSLS